MKFAVIQFPGSNCDQDCLAAINGIRGAQARYVWHKDRSLDHFDAIVLPGGFSYGDYLRTGAIARFSPIMQSVIAFANAGGKVLGVCNGFQILCESHLLPGALLRNAHQQFSCKNIFVKDGDGDVFKLPVAHGDGRFYADEKTLDALELNNQVLLRYCTADGTVTGEANPNGAARNIAGICNVERNIFGMMPHPERACTPQLGNTDGREVLRKLFESVPEFAAS